MNKKKRLSKNDKETIDIFLKNGFTVSYIMIMFSEKYTVDCIMNYIRMTTGTIIKRNGEWYEKIEI